jgi:hypothetical protein
MSRKGKGNERKDSGDMRILRKEGKRGIEEGREDGREGYQERKNINMRKERNNERAMKGGTGTVHSRKEYWEKQRREGVKERAVEERVAGMKGKKGVRTEGRWEDEGRKEGR